MMFQSTKFIARKQTQRSNLVSGYFVAVNKHKMSHLKIKPYPCELCNKAFSFKQALEAHMTMHTKQGKHRCQQCGKIYTVSASLRRHRLVQRKCWWTDTYSRILFSPRHKCVTAKMMSDTIVGAKHLKEERDKNFMCKYKILPKSHRIQCTKSK